MTNFWEGFEKRALSHGHLILGTATAGASAGLVDALHNQHVVRKREAALPNDKNIDSFVGKLEPGDLVYTSYKVPKHLSKKERAGKMTVFLGGHDKYHVGMHTGNGEMTNVEGMGENARRTTLKDLLDRRAHGKASDYSVVAYRPHNLSGQERAEAAEFTKKFIGTKYPSEKDFAKRTMKMMARIKGDPNIKPGVRDMICTDLAVAAYPGEFKKRYSAPVEMQANKNFTPIARHGTLKHDKAPEFMYKKVYPALGAISGAGVGTAAGLAVAGGMKAVKMLKHGSDAAIDSWMGEYEEEASKKKGQHDGETDPITAQMSFTPDTYFRGNP